MPETVQPPFLLNCARNCTSTGALWGGHCPWMASKAMTWVDMQSRLSNENSSIYLCIDKQRWIPEHSGIMYWARVPTKDINEFHIHVANNLKLNRVETLSIYVLCVFLPWPIIGIWQPSIAPITPGNPLFSSNLSIVSLTSWPSGKWINLSAKRSTITLQTRW